MEPGVALGAYVGLDKNGSNSTLMVGLTRTVYYYCVDIPNLNLVGDSNHKESYTR